MSTNTISTNNREFKIKQIISRSILAMIWLSLPTVLIFDFSEKVTVCIIIFTGFIFFSHCCITYIYKDLVDKEKKWPQYFLILLFGPTQAERLKKERKIMSQSS